MIVLKTPRLAAAFLVTLALGSHAPPAAANFLFPEIGPAMACKLAIRGAEMRSTIPPQLLAAIGRVESGRRDPLTGGISPWPWTINAEGQGHFFDTKAQAIAAVQALQARGVRSIDVGCLQVNLMHHPDAFASLEQAFDPNSNALYAAEFLNQLHDQLGTWPRAAAAYHSQSPGLGDDYQQKVMAAWPQERLAAGGAAPDVGATQAGVPMLGEPVHPFPRMTGAVSAGAIYNTARGGLSPYGAAPPAHIIPLPSGGGGMMTANHGLDFYRSRPIAVATR